MASDLSSFLKDELANTLEQLLSKSVSVDSISQLDTENLEDSQCINISIKLEFADISSPLQFFIPTITATKFEYFMLGGMGDLKEHIDDEIADAVNEIVSNICGSFSTAVNAQGFPDASSIKTEVTSSNIKDCAEIKDLKNMFFFDLSLDSEKLPIYIAFDEIILPYFSQITGYAPSDDVKSLDSDIVSSNTSSKPVAQQGGNNKTLGISSLLSEESAENLQLLFGIKLKLSVRLGTKNVLLKDILRWDIGEIIELDQMVNEPLEILVNGVKIGEGEAVIVEGKFGLKVKSIGDGSSRLSQIGLK